MGLSQGLSYKYLTRVSCEPPKFAKQLLISTVVSDSRPGNMRVGPRWVHAEDAELRGRYPLRAPPGTNCIKISLPGKQILSKRKGLREVLFS